MKEDPSGFRATRSDETNRTYTGAKGSEGIWGFLGETILQKSMISNVLLLLISFSFLKKKIFC